MKQSSKGTKSYSGNFLPLLCFLGLPASLPEGKCCYRTLGIRSRTTRCTCMPGRRHAHIHNTLSLAHTFSQTHNRHTPTLPLTPAVALTHRKAHFYTHQALTPTHPPTLTRTLTNAHTHAQRLTLTNMHPHPGTRPFTFTHSLTVTPSFYTSAGPLHTLN